MAARSRARKRALEILFEADLRGVDPLVVLARRIESADTAPNPYVTTLVHGVQEHRARIDALLSTYAEGWPLERMAPVDRNLLRIGAFELLWNDDVPDPVAIDEAVGLAQELSTDESPAFVNGMLARLMELKPTLAW